MSRTLPLNEVKAHLSSVVDEVETTHDRVVVTKHGKGAVVMLALDDLEAIEETLALLAEPLLVSDLTEARASRTAGTGVSLADFKAGIGSHP